MCLYVALIAECRLLQGPGAAQALWRELGIPGLQAQLADLPKTNSSPPRLKTDFDDDTHHVGAFAKDCMKPSLGRCRSSMLYAAYCDYCNERGIARCSQREFKGILRDRGYHWRKSSFIYVDAVSLLPAAAQSSEVQL